MTTLFAWIGWALLGFVVYYESGCVSSSLGRAFHMILAEIQRILN